MKKLISLLLCAVLMFSTAAVAFAQPEKPSPVLFIAGLNTCELKLDGETVFPPSGDKVTATIKGALLPAAKSIVTLQGWEVFTKTICDAVNEIFEPVKMNPDTTSKHPVYIDDSPRYSTTADFYNEGADYFFTYDWRCSPLDIADLLAERIDAILLSTGCDKITLYSHSMGGCVLMSYLEKYGHAKVDKLLIANPAFQGMDFVGELFNGVMKLDADTLTNFLTDMLSTTDYAWVSALLEVLNTLMITDGICYFGNDVLLKNMLDTVCAELGDFFFYLPALWSFCPVSYYESAKRFAFGDTPDAKVSALIAKNDYYIYNVQTKVKTILDSCIADGIPVSVVCFYNSPAIPIVPSAVNQSDGMIDAKYSSAGAVCAPYGETLGSGYAQKVSDSHNHISPDCVIDASTCMYPEYTWFIKNIKHSNLTDDINAFYDWIIAFDGQPTVHSNSDYPQFMNSDPETRELTVLEAEKSETTFLTRLIARISEIFKLLFSIIGR